MIRGVVWLLLAVSILFNVFFAAGYVAARAEAPEEPGADPIVRSVTDELELDEQQAQAFARLRSEHEREASVYMEGQGLARQSLLEELSRDEPDLEKVREIVERSAELHRERRLAETRRFSEFLGVLSPRQCRILSERVRGPGRGGPPWRKRLERFDRDGDGELDEQERAEAQAHVEEWRRRRHERHEALLERFDTNGDGRLDLDERRAARAWMEENGEGRPPRHGPPRHEPPPP
ncbi:MAG: periplasmic heavy metal sensor [Planctomycetota bacterium]|jgi:Spy/CpxP family protein refolding chaperone